MSVVLFYVDDILIWSQLDGEAERIFDMLAKKYKLDSLKRVVRAK